jgi:ATP-dependent RNA helicase DHX8/PRP22
MQLRAMRQAKNVREQLINIIDRRHHQIVSCGRETEKVRRLLS